MGSSNVAALLTCHNRVERTLSCLHSLASQVGIETKPSVFLVDAGSSDGTVESVRQRYPEVTVVQEGPELFWNGGMRVALGRAHRHDPDYYLWLNDDVELDADAVQRLLDCHHELAVGRQAPSIVVGTTRDPVTGVATYGGVVRPDRLRRLRYQLVRPGSEPRRAETMNGNCVLIPRAVVARVGTLAEAYTHGMGDFDYGHRATRAGCEVWVAPGTIGTCARNPASRPAASLNEHRQRATSPTGGLPPSEWATFVRRWGGPMWPVLAMSPYVKGFLRWAAAQVPHSVRSAIPSARS